MADLSVEVIEDILSRLPVMDLLRFRCVSKPWCSLIDSSHFIKLHLNRSIETNTNLNLILQDRTSHEFHFVDFDSLDCMVKPNSKNFEGLATQVWGSCNGLLCLYSDSQKCNVLWNPSTRKSHNLPDTPIEHPNPAKVNYTVFYGFGYESTSDDYKVLRIVHFFISNDLPYAYHQSQVDLYSLKSNSWRRVHDFPPSFKLELREHECTLVDGALHWVGTLITDFGVPKLFIIAFDLGVEEFRFVPLPKNSKNIIHARVGVFGGSLCLLSCWELFGFDMWLMKDYGVKQSWTKLFSIVNVFVEMARNVFAEFLKPIAWSKSGDKMLIEEDIYGLFQYDFKKKRIKKVKIRGAPEYFNLHVCLGSLVQLDGDGGSNEKQ